MMVTTREVTSEACIADILLSTEAALGELHHYYKSGRHQGACPERSYFLFSLCGRLLFSLWLTEGESPAGTFDYSPRLGNLIAELNFASLRDTEGDKDRRHEDACQGRLRNDPRWFTFWLSMLERQYRNGPSDCRALYETTLAYVDRPGFLEGKLCKKKRKALSNFTKTDTAGRLMYQSMLVLDEIVSAMIYRFTRSDQSMHTTERLASLICVLNQVRRIVVSETPVEGPYVLGANRWGTPSTFSRVFSGRNPGTLRVVPKREGGAVICTYETSGAKPTKRSWTRATSELKHGYEDELFKTWSYETGKHHRAPDDADAYAGWQVQYDESKRLRLYFLHIEAVLRTFASNPNYSGLLSDVSNHQNKWMGRMLAWTCIKKLDELLEKLNAAYRETSVLLSGDAQNKVIATMWPPKASPYRQRADRPIARESADAEPSPPSPSSTTAPQAEAERIAAETPAADSRPQINEAPAQQRPSDEPAPVDACPPDDLTKPIDRMPPSPSEVSATPEEIHQVDEEVEERQDPAEQPQDNTEALAASPAGEPDHEPTPEKSGSASPETAAAADQPAEPSASPELSPVHQVAEQTTDPEQQPDQTVDDSLAHGDPPPSTTPQSVLESPDENAREEVSAEPDASCQSGESTREPTPPQNQPQVDDGGIPLTQTLLQRHRPANGPANYAPVSQKQLQQELGCTRTELQRTMKRIFGPKPFAAYRKKCKTKTIGDVLEEFGHGPTGPQDDRTDDPDQRALIAEMVSDRSLCEQITQSTPKKCQSRQAAYKNRTKHKRQRT